MVQIKIVRHSERLDFSHPFYWLICFGHYWADSPLTINGHKTANEKGKTMICNGFSPKHIYTSPYSRTIATAIEIKASFLNSEIIIEPLLAEYQPYNRHRISLYPDGIPTVSNEQETGFNYPENYENFSKRILFIISKLIDKNDDLIIVTHGEVLKTYINYIQNLYPDIMLDSGATPYLTVLSFEYDNINKKIIELSVKIE